VPVRLHVANDGKRGLPGFRIEDQMPAFPPLSIFCEQLPRDEWVTLETVRPSNRRGIFEAGDVRLSTGAPFGFMRFTRNLEALSSIRVVPRWVELSSFPLLEPSSYPHEELHERARIGAGQEFLGVREYRPGDPMRSIHWRTSARAAHLVVREYEQEAATRVVIVLAGRDYGTPPDSAFEALVSAAASVARYALVTGHPVELARAGADGIERSPAPDPMAVLDWLAGARPVDSDLASLVSASLSRGVRRSTVVLLAPTAGRAAASLPSAVRAAQTTAARVLAVLARASSWDSTVEEEHPPIAGRAVVRMIEKGRDLRTCLQG
jgi:uncharacterized protein (DUF58 family)